MRISDWSSDVCSSDLQSGLAMSSPCSTQVEAFWSNSDQNGVTSANTIRIRSTARAPSTASSGCTPRARSSCIEAPMPPKAISRSEEHTSELQSLMRISYAVFCLKKKNTEHTTHKDNT